MSELAVVVLAHADPLHLSRLVNALEELPIFLHCDAKTKPVQFNRMLQLPKRVTMLPRIDTRLASWSLVAAELSGLRAALGSTRAEHIAVLTGADYPLVPMQELLDSLRVWRGHSLVNNSPLPFPKWSTRRHPDGGQWRMRYRALTWHDNLVSFLGVPIAWPIRREVPEELELRASSQWKIFTRTHVELLLAVADSRPDLISFWRSTFIPEESFAASILSSRSLVGSEALRPTLATAWHYDFTVGSHPRWLRSADFDQIAGARNAPLLDPESAYQNERPLAPHRKFFARKFSSDLDPELTERIDAELRR